MEESPDAAEPVPPEDFMGNNLEPDKRRWPIVVAALTAAAVAAAVGWEVTGSHGSRPPSAVTAGSGSPAPERTLGSLSPEQQQAGKLAQQTGASLLEQHQASDGGWRFKSAIQAPNSQTDRDVGAAGVGMGFLTLARQYPDDTRWLNGAEQTAGWLLAVSEQDTAGGRYWPDYNNGGGDVSDSHYTSFDDGTIGIGDFFWQLYDLTHDNQYKTAAVQAVQWTLAQAEDAGSTGKPAYRWRWDTSDKASGYQMGMGEGQAGIIDALATFYSRTKDSDPVFAARCKRYADGALRYLDQVRAAAVRELGDNHYAHSLPETSVIGQDGDTEMDSGYVSGTAGAAYLYLHLYKVFGDDAYLREARAELDWLNNTGYGPKVDFGNGAAAWKLAINPEGGGDNHYAAGIEEGAAGIGWVFLQDYLLTGNQTGYNTAKQAANWLLKAARKDSGGGLSWPEYTGSKLVHPNLDNGAAGIGMFLQDMYAAAKARHDPDADKYLAGAEGAQQWLAATAAHSGGAMYWRDSDGGTPFARDPSWHWGSAGIAAFFARMAGGKTDMPGEQPGL